MTGAVTVLTMQTGALANLSQRLRTGSIGDILQLHAPIVTHELKCLLDAKDHRVWMTLDFLVSDSEPLKTEILPGSTLKQNSPEEDWIMRLEARMANSDPHPFRDGQVYPLRLLNNVYPLKEAAEVASRRYIEADVVVTQGEITSGQKLLDDIARNTEQLRVFLIDKFELSDVL